MHSVFVLELHVIFNYINVLIVAQQCRYGKFMSPAKLNLHRSSYNVPEDALKTKEWLCVRGRL
jgi:hypothetical protein